MHFCRSMIDRGGTHSNLHWGQATSSRDYLPPINACCIGSGTGCPYLVSTAEWTTLSAAPGALLVTTAHGTSDADDGDGAEDGEGGDAHNSGASLGGGGSSTHLRVHVEAEKEAPRSYGWPWRLVISIEREIVSGARVKDMEVRYALICRTWSRVPHQSLPKRDNSIAHSKYFWYVLPLLKYYSYHGTLQYVPWL